MRKRALSILLCAAMTLSLAACGGGQTGSNSTEPPAESTSSGQQTTEPESTQPESTQPEETEPVETEPEETKPTETESEETQPTETAPEASAFLALLQAEYKSDTALGLTEQHAYFQSIPQFTSVNWEYEFFSFGDTLYGFCQDDKTWFAYDTATKTQTQLTGPDIDKNGLSFFLDGAIYYFDDYDSSTLIKDDLHGNTMTFSKPAEYSSFPTVYYGGGFLCFFDLSKDGSLYSRDLQKIADIPAPQQEVAHGLTETVELNADMLRMVGEKIYAGGSNDHLYSLDTTAEAPEWTDLGEIGAQPDLIISYIYGDSPFSRFLGKYYYSFDDNSIYDMTTWEKVFELGELYAPAEGRGKIYFGGDSYIGYNGKEYRMVNLADGTMSDPLKLPEKYNSDFLVFINDTYCVYSDEYGCFLWDYNTGEETTIVMFEQN